MGLKKKKSVPVQERKDHEKVKQIEIDNNSDSELNTSRKF